MKTLIVMLIFFSSRWAGAACSSPAGIAGQFQWISANSDMEFCNGSNWVSSLVSTTANTCSTAGQVQYKTSPIDMQFCDGTHWNSMTSTATDGSCSGTAVGTVHYNIVNNYEEWCDGASWWVMYAQPSLNLNLLTGVLPIQVRFSNASGAGIAAPSYYNSAGVIASASENLLKYSQDLTQSGSWGASSGSIVATASSTAAPDGTTTGSQLSVTSSPLYGSGFTQGLSIGTGVSTYTLSAYVKEGATPCSGSSGFLQINMLNGSSQNARAGYTLTGSGSVNGSGSPGPSATSITNVGNGWYRVSVTVANTGGNNYLVAYVWPSTTQNESCSSYVWGAQLESASSPSSYIYTTTAAAYGPRFDFNPSTLALNGLLIEESRTNLALNSAISTSTSWSLSASASLTPSTTVAPDGTVSGSVLTASATGFQNIYQIVAVPNDTVARTFSLYVYGGTAAATTVVKLQYVNGTGGTDQVSMNWPGGTASAYPAGPTYPVIQQALPNGWYRLSTTLANNGGTSLEMIVYPANGATGSVTIWGAQLETGTFPTSYIPTTTTSMTRSADMASVNNASFFGASQGTLVASAIPGFLYFNSAAGTGYAPQIAASLESDFNDRLQIRRSASSTTTDGFTCGMYDSGGTVALNASGSNGSWPMLTSGKLALAYQASNFAESTNGAAAATASTGSVFSPTQLVLGNSAYYGNFWNGWLQSVQYFNTRLTNSQIQQLTNIGLP